MSKKATQTSDAVENRQATIYDELLKNGTAVLKAKTREGLAEMVDNIPADCRYSVGAVGHCLDDDTYSIRVDLTENKN